MDGGPIFHCGGARDIESEPFYANRWWGKYPPKRIMRRSWRILAMERKVIVSVLSVALVQLAAARATAEGNYKKICRVGVNLRLLDDSADANSCRTIAVNSRAQEYQIGCSDGENTDNIIITAPFHITDKAARVTTSKLAAYAQNTAHPEQFEKCAKAWGSR